eukprot:CAMPEP_0206580220 /NCGR_PEP_ID=MMETSP0325_2-20121206/33022_1 /ASSEMBLY_ACC=CAM_ASM_000347 /TAXON_ID=2866 /ORGANISM="Crypthecodinium cohnii, Strain Seligo" /LENGTH=59 /DNA_ID=CAMNT_0054086195 /DNA_START=147 /DNA_END=326 /DNA_ORIENTATION=+
MCQLVGEGYEPEAQSILPMFRMSLRFEVPQVEEQSTAVEGDGLSVLFEDMNSIEGRDLE